MYNLEKKIGECVLIFATCNLKIIENQLWLLEIMESDHYPIGVEIQL
ncbi:hypothetical protein [Methanobacterium sp.]|nr:hypothetical protein [Methanobacterium sp.]MDY9924324.1 hypothetical protein [Methanobacterium sp.]